MSQYASQTSVSSDKSRAEIEHILRRYGAEEFIYGWRNTEAVIGFKMEDRHIRFNLPMPERSDFKFTPTGRSRSSDAAYREWEQSCRQRWRALVLVIKAKLEAVESGISIFEDEFLANIVLPSGDTVGAWLRPQIESTYAIGHMPKMLPGPSDDH